MKEANNLFMPVEILGVAHPDSEYEESDIRLRFNQATAAELFENVEPMGIPKYPMKFQDGTFIFQYDDLDPRADMLFERMMEFIRLVDP
jgi:hypothetical protein